MEKIVGYVRVIAGARVNQLGERTFLGKHFLRLGQSLGFWTYFFQLAGILGAKYNTKLDAFGEVFLGMRGESGAMERYFRVLAKEVCVQSLSDSVTFDDYIVAAAMKRIHFSGNAFDFIRKHGMQKIMSDSATEAAWQFAECGAAFGAICPNDMRNMFERTHAPIPKEKFEKALAAGLDIPNQQDIYSYEEVESDEDGLFVSYCKECCPSIYEVLIKNQIE